MTALRPTLPRPIHPHPNLPPSRGKGPTRPATIPRRVCCPAHARVCVALWIPKFTNEVQHQTKVLIGVRQPSKAAEPVAAAMAAILGSLPPEFRQTITFDNGTEFARHYELHARGIETYFCDTYSPWQKGGVENAIGRMRWVLPRKTDLAAVSDEAFTALMQAYNNTPRKCLDYRTPGRGPRPGVALQM